MITTKKSKIGFWYKGYGVHVKNLKVLSFLNQKINRIRIDINKNGPSFYFKLLEEFVENGGEKLDKDNRVKFITIVYYLTKLGYIKDNDLNGVKVKSYTTKKSGS